MYCPKCGKSNKNDAKFCVHCGTSLTSEKATEKSSKEAVSKKGKSPKKIIIGIIIAALVLFLASGLFKKSGLAGKYVNLSNEDDVMELQKDGTYHNIESGIRTRGEYKVRGNRIEFNLNVFGVPLTVECTKVRGGFDCETGDRYRKR